MVPRYADALATRGQPVALKSAPYAGFPQSADLFGDGSVVVVPMPGHTPGSLGVFVNVDATHRYFHVGDALNERRQAIGLLGKRRVMAETDVDAAQTADQVWHLHALVEQNPSLKLLPAHERAAWVEAFGSPGCPR